MEMEETVKEQSLSVGNSARSKLLRYPLRSSSKFKESKPDPPDATNSSASKRGLSTPSVSRSVVGLNFSGKDKSTGAKPPRRLSVPVKASSSPNPKLIGNITPISDTRKVRYGNDDQGPQSRSQTPASDIPKTHGRMKFNLISSSSYWLNQIQLSESAAKHSVSLGFFKLAWEARCEPFPKMQDELKSYVQRHRLAELEEVKELLQSYRIAENIEQSQVSESISQVPEEEGTRSSGEEVHCCSSSITDTEKVKPEPLETESTRLTPVKTEQSKKETDQKNNLESTLREDLKKNPANSRPASDRGSSGLVKKSKKPTNKQQTKKGSSGVKTQHKKSDVIKGKIPISPTGSEENAQGNKENMDVRSTDEVATVTVAVGPLCHQPHWTRRFDPFTHEREVLLSPSMCPPPSRTRLVALGANHFIFLLIKCRLGNIKVHTRLVYLSCQPLDLTIRYHCVLPINFLSSFILDIQGAAREVWP
ncbi:hypothetical protein LR48_Vigan01g281200 [Vigna angularis]|uniref:Uncharacterized protein n=1 Tax=Phaseolus angularis TaxID=3914 RepID=A0A0L9TRY7_PHAAN|nr:hypothetical protein LR48_Vigan01g281200 [Vigna angularis]